MLLVGDRFYFHGSSAALFRAAALAAPAIQALRAKRDSGVLRGPPCPPWFESAGAASTAGKTERIAINPAHASTAAPPAMTGGRREW
jgi:hypothetical protein